MSKPRILDLFCGAGGAAMGYHRAGFEVIGVDIKPQPNYPFEFHQGDAMTVLAHAAWNDQYHRDGVIMLPFGLDYEGFFQAIHASPPCQRYIRGGLSDKEKHPDLLGLVRDRVEQIPVPWVIENVPGAPMRADIVLCGSMFGLDVRRHRWFETSWGASVLTPPCDHSRPVTGVYGNAHGKAGAWPGMLPSDLKTWNKAMGVDWMTAPELTDAIPPSYTQFVGEQLLAHLREEVAA